MSANFDVKKLKLTKENKQLHIILLTCFDTLDKFCGGEKTVLQLIVGVSILLVLIKVTGNLVQFFCSYNVKNAMLLQ